MKKVLLFVAVVAFIGTTSCKKDYDCACTIDGDTTITTIPDAKKKDAESACDQLSTAASVAGGSCSLD